MGYFLLPPPIEHWIQIKITEWISTYQIEFLKISSI